MSATLEHVLRTTSPFAYCTDCANDDNDAVPLAYPLEMIIGIASCVANGVHCLLEKGVGYHLASHYGIHTELFQISHGNIKPSNVLFDQQGTPKLAIDIGGEPSLSNMDLASMTAFRSNFGYLAVRGLDDARLIQIY